MQTLTIKYYFRFISLMLILTTFLPVIYQNLPIIGKYGIWSAIWLFSLLIIKPDIFLKKNVFNFLIYGAIVLIICMNTIWVAMDESMKRILFNEFIYIFVAVTIYDYYISSKDYNGYKLLIKLAYCFIFITALTSILASVINPMYARLLTQSSSDFRIMSQGVFLQRIGGAGYSFGQSIVCIIPLLFFFYKYNKLLEYSKIIVFFVCSACFLAILRMQFFANILLAILLIILSVLCLKSYRRSIGILSVAFILLYTLPAQFYSISLHSAASLLNVKSNVYRKINDSANYIEADFENIRRNEASNRISRYPMLFEAFIRSPIFGNAALPKSDQHNILRGYHIHWMGKIAATGFAGFLIFLFPIVSFLKPKFKLYSYPYVYYAALSYSSFLLLGLMKTLSGREVWLTFFVIVPGSSLLMSSIRQNTK